MRLLTFLFLIAMFSCSYETTKEPTSTINHSDVLGYWKIVAATRNGKETSTLVDSYIHFESVEEMNTNLFGSDTTQSLVWSDSIAMISDSSMTFKINAINSDSLELSFKLQRHLFKLLFLKQKTEDTIVIDQMLE